MLATIGVAGLASTPLVGWLTDHVGAGFALVGALLVAGVGTGCFALADKAGIAFLAAAFFGAGAGSMWTAMNSLLAEAVLRDSHVRVFSFNNAAANIGIGAGAAIAALVLGGTSPGPYQLMFGIDAASFALFAVVLALTREFSGRAAGQTARPDTATAAAQTIAAAPAENSAAAEPTTTGPGAARAGWRTVLSDRVLVAVTVLNAILIIAMYSQLTAAFPAWSTGPAHSTAQVVGLATAVNTLLIAGLQPLLIGRIERLVRTTAAAAGSLLFAGSWLVALAAPHWHGGTLTGVALVTALALAALGEILLAPSLMALVNSLAPDGLVGRYNAFFNLAWQVGPIVGPAVAGVLIGQGLGGPFLIGLAVVCALAAGYARALQVIVPPAANGVTLETKPG